MSVPSPALGTNNVFVSPTPRTSRASAVSPVHWLRAFAYTPHSSRVQDSHQHHDLAVDDRIPPSDDDALPTDFHSHSRTVGARARIPAPGFEAYISAPSATVPPKLKRRNRGTRDQCTSDDFPATHRPSSRRSMRRIRACACPTREGGRGDLGASTSSPPSRPRSRRVVLDAVEIVSKRRSHGRLADTRAVRVGSPSECSRTLAPSHYPSPPVSREFGEVTVHDGSFHTVHPIPEVDPVLPLKASKYFARAPPHAQSATEKIPVPTPPGFPILHIEPSDFEYPPLNVSLDESVKDAEDEPGYIPSWHTSPRLFDDFMIMLRRLKPILVQETVRDDPWKVLVAVRLLNVTTGKAAIPVFCKLISRWSTPEDLVNAPHHELVELLRPLGLYNKRARWLKNVSERFIEDRQVSLASVQSEGGVVAATPHLSYPGVGPYALDSLRIFCAGEDEWKRVIPRDKELVRYLRWRWCVEEQKVWYPGGVGVVGDLDVPYLITLVDELAAHYDGAIGGEGYMYHFCSDLCDALRYDANVPSTP